MGDARIHATDVADVFTGLDGLLAGAAAEQPAPDEADQASPHVAEVRTSRPYAQLVHREIDSIEYARRLKEEVVGQREGECSDARRRRAAQRVRHLELQQRKAALYEEYVSAQRAAYEIRGHQMRVVSRLVGDLVFHTLALATVLMVMWVGGVANGFGVVGDGARQLAETAQRLVGSVPDRVPILTNASLVATVTLCLIALVLRTRRPSAESPS